MDGKTQTGDCRVELEIPYFVDDEFFGSEMDKLSFFRTIERADDEEDLKFIRESFMENNSRIPENLDNIFNMVRLRIFLRKYGIVQVKKTGDFYLMEFGEKNTIENVRNFLEYDTEGYSVLSSLQKIRLSAKHWKSDRGFMEYWVEKMCPKTQ